MEETFPTTVDELGRLVIPPRLTWGEWRRVYWSGNPPHSPVVMGWTLRLGRSTDDYERAWLRAHGFRFSGGKWGRPDQ